MLPESWVDYYVYYYYNYYAFRQLKTQTFILLVCTNRKRIIYLRLRNIMHVPFLVILHCSVGTHKYPIPE